MAVTFGPTFWPICAGSGAAVLEVQHGRFEVGEVESATYFVTKSNGR